MSKNYNIEKKGLLRIEDIINDFGCAWQGIDHQNDKGLDGMIILRKKNYDTGDLVFVQVKTGTTYKYDFKGNRDDFGVNLVSEDLKRWKKYWNSQPIPVILLFVNPEEKDKNNNSKVWWVNLKDNNVYSTTNKGQILIKKNQIFNLHSKGDLFKLCGRRVVENAYYRLEATKEITNIYKLSLPIGKQARMFYAKWKEDFNERNINKVIVNRVGWRHITRRGRPLDRVTISFQLFGVAKKLLELYQNGLVSSVYLRHIDSMENESYVKNMSFHAIRAKVSFSSRSDAIIQIILKKTIKTCKNTGDKTEKVWFYSIHELRRGHKLISE